MASLFRVALFAVVCFSWVACRHAPVSNSALSTNTVVNASNCFVNSSCLPINSFVLSINDGRDLMHGYEAKPTFLPLSNASQEAIFLQTDVANDNARFMLYDSNEYLAVDEKGMLIFDTSMSTAFLHIFVKIARSQIYYILLAKRSVNGSEKCFLVRPNKPSLPVPDPSVCKDAYAFHDLLESCVALQRIKNNTDFLFQKPFYPPSNLSCSPLKGKAAECCSCDDRRDDGRK